MYIGREYMWQNSLVHIFRPHYCRIFNGNITLNTAWQSANFKYCDSYFERISDIYEPKGPDQFSISSKDTPLQRTTAQSSLLLKSSYLECAEFYEILIYENDLPSTSPRKNVSFKFVASTQVYERRFSLFGLPYVCTSCKYTGVLGNSFWAQWATVRSFCGLVGESNVKNSLVHLRARVDRGSLLFEIGIRL